MARAFGTSKAATPNPFKILSEELVVVPAHHAELIIHFNYTQGVAPGKTYLLRMIVRAETYNSKAVVESWDGDRWNPLVFIPKVNIAISESRSYIPNAKQAVKRVDFDSDTESLYNRVKTVLQ